MIITVSTTNANGVYRPDLPEGITGSNPEYSADHQSVTVTLSDTPEVEQWAVEQGYHVPERVDPGHLMVAVYQSSPELHAQIEAAIDADPMIRSAMRSSFVSRTSTLLQGMQQQFGITDEQRDALFVAAYLIKL